MSRFEVIASGLIGLSGAVIFTALCILIAQQWLPVLLTSAIIVGGLFLFLIVFSLAEIPLMIFGIGRIATSANPKARYLALLTTAGYVFFGAVYAAPFILLTGRVGMGVALASLSVVRFITALIFLSR
jgi:hypothetical protein